MSNSKDFNGKVVIITGSSSGIGAKAAEDFAKYGAQVVITDYNEKNLPEIGKKCLKASPKGLKPLEVVADVSKEEDCKRLIDSTIKAFGRLDILVNNAGTGVLDSSLEATDILKKFDHMIKVNLRSVVCLTHLSVKYLEKTKGNIINISSMASLKPMAQFPYGISKCGIDFFTKCAALELGPNGIRVNVINLAGVRTNFAQALGIPKEASDKYYDSLLPCYPIGRGGTVQDISNYILFLASDECSWITGINFVADGGLLNAPIPKLEIK